MIDVEDISYICGLGPGCNESQQNKGSTHCFVPKRQHPLFCAEGSATEEPCVRGHGDDSTSHLRQSPRECEQHVRDYFIGEFMSTSRAVSRVRADAISSQRQAAVGILWHSVGIGVQILAPDASGRVRHEQPVTGCSDEQQNILN
jgi:hypothetical protein